MPFERKRSSLTLTPDWTARMIEISRSRTEPVQRSERSKILLAYAAGETVSSIARKMKTNRPKIERCVDKALQMGALAALDDLSGRGKRPDITGEARAWVVALACQKPKDLGYSHELWTTRLLAKHARENCEKEGHVCLNRLSRGTVSKMLTKSEVRPHKIRYYLERRDPEFETKMAQVLYVYREVRLLRESGGEAAVAILSYDEKPGIQALGNLAADLPPVPGKHPCVGRDHQYKRYGTVTLMAGIDLLDGRVHGIVTDRHRSREFVAFLKMLDKRYPVEKRVRIVLDNHSAHISKETRAYLAATPNRFEFIFTPKHGSWLNLIESFFAKMSKSMLRGIRVLSKAELKERIEKYLDELNADPVVFRWKYGLDSISIT